jgi:ATP-binding cassette, subfamily A (ABC1), member 3
VVLQLKGFPAKQVEEEVSRMVREVGLEAKRKALVKTLSGGMKRKLSVGIALCGGSKVT